MTMPILQSMGPLDEHMDKIWWKFGKNDDIQVYNHFEGRVEKEKLHRHLKNDDLFVFSGARFYRGPLQCGAIIVPSSVMKRL